MFQRLLIALAHVLAGNTSENVFKRSCQILYILCTMQKKLLRITNVFPNFGMYYRWKNIKSHTKTKNLKYQLPRGIRKLNYLMDHILYQIFKIILNISLRNMGKRQISLQKEYMQVKSKKESSLKLSVLFRTLLSRIYQMLHKIYTLC